MVDLRQMFPELRKTVPCSGGAEIGGVEILEMLGKGGIELALEEGPVCGQPLPEQDQVPGQRGRMLEEKGKALAGGLVPLCHAEMGHGWGGNVLWPGGGLPSQAKPSQPCVVLFFVRNFNLGAIYIALSNQSSS